MQLPDYTQRAEDHQAFLVLVKHLGKELKPKSFKKVFERINRIQNVRIHSHQRTMWIRCKDSYPVVNNDWGDFQAHRRVLGVIGVGNCETEQELQELYSNYEDTKDQYLSTLYDSRLIVFGMNQDGSVIEKIDAENTSKDSTNSNGNKKEQNGSTNGGEVEGIGKERTKDMGDVVEKSKQDPELPKISDPLQEIQKNKNGDYLESETSFMPTASNQNEVKESRSRSGSNLSRESLKTHVWFYPDYDSCTDLEEKFTEFALSLFWVLEGKRVDRSFEKKLTLLMAPFEKKDSGSLDTEARKPPVEKSDSKKKFFFLEPSNSGDRSQLMAVMVDSQKVYRKRCQGRLRKHLGDLCLLAGVPGEAILHYQTSLDSLKSANDWLWLAAAYEGLCSASVILMYPREEKSSFQRNLSLSAKRGSSMLDEAKLRTGSLQSGGNNGLDLAGIRIKNCLMGDDIIDKYKEAIVHYSKFKNAGIIELEASVKACRVLILQHKYLQASEFLQNVVYINLQLSDDEKIERYSTLAVLYQEIGFHRKSAFFKRVAAMQCVAPQNTNPAWLKCYYLLLQALEGFGLTLDAKQYQPGVPTGWPVVQSRVLQELVYCARKMNTPVLAIRHMTFLLHSMHDHLSPQDKKELISLIETYTAKNEGKNQPLALENGTLLPPVPMINLPQVRALKLLHLCPTLRPHPLPVAGGNSLKPSINSPFIYSPIQFSTPLTRKKKDNSKADFKWVEGDICEIDLTLFNPMPVDLKVSSLSLITEGVEFESHPTSMVLPTDVGNHLVKILGTPKSSGKLKILGYTAQALGVRSNCRFCDIRHIKHDDYTVEVVPQLPQMQVTTSLPRTRSYCNLEEANTPHKDSAIITVYAGESYECQITLKNTSSLPIEKVQMFFDSKVRKNILDKLFEWNLDNLQSQLPIQPGSQAVFTLYINGISDFISPDSAVIEEASNVASPTTRPRSRRVDTTPIEMKASQSWSNFQDVDKNKRNYKAVLNFEYSGGPGLVSEHCRHVSVPLDVTVQNSLVFSSWDVTPGESSDCVQVTLDVNNVTEHSIDVEFDGQTKTIQDKQAIGISIPVRHCAESVWLEAALDSSHDNSILHQPSKSHSRALLEYLSHSVDMKWKMPVQRKCGKMIIEKLPWSQRQLDMIKQPPLQWVVSVNSHVYNPREVPTLSVGEPVQIDVSLTSSTDLSVGESFLSVQCFQDFYNGAQSYCQEDEVSIIGCHNCRLPELQKDATYSHSCMMVFYNTGMYKLDIRCSALAENVSMATGKQVDIMEMPQPQSDIVKIWRCSPVVELNVT